MYKKNTRGLFDFSWTFKGYTTSKPDRTKQKDAHQFTGHFPIIQWMDKKLVLQKKLVAVQGFDP